VGVSFTAWFVTRQWILLDCVDAPDVTAALIYFIASAGTGNKNS